MEHDDSKGTLHFKYLVPGNDFTHAGEASGNVKTILKKLGISPDIIRRVSISMYEAEINMVIHAGGGVADIYITPEKIVMDLKDEGPGICDVPLAMKEGYSTAPDTVRALGFGAGMGLPNIKKYTDELKIDTEISKGTTVHMTIYIKQN